MGSRKGVKARIKSPKCEATKIGLSTSPGVPSANLTLCPNRNARRLTLYLSTPSLETKGPAAKGTISKSKEKQWVNRSATALFTAGK
jgi:hypothetical protein